MTAYLLDTNVISELTRPVPNPQVIDFLQHLEEGYLSVITVHELHFGLQCLPEGRRRRSLSEMIETCLSQYGDYVLPVTQAEASAAGVLRSMALSAGRTLHLADALIAATAWVGGLTLATRNTADFNGLSIALSNPWL